eukprot:355043-Chlamydomonas_euryale.AAC.3
MSSPQAAALTQRTLPPHTGAYPPPHIPPLPALHTQVIPSPFSLRRLASLPPPLTRGSLFTPGPPLLNSTYPRPHLPPWPRFPLTGVVGMHVLILRPKVAPLEAVHRSQVAFLTVRKPKAVEELAAGVAVPDVHPAVTQLVGVGGAADKPQQLLQHAAPKHALGGEQRERAPQVVARSAAEEGERAGAGAVGAEHTRADDAVHQVEVLHSGVGKVRGGSGAGAEVGEGREGGGRRR